MTLIWLTRGRTWGFRFLRDGGFDDPLPAYEGVFQDLPNGSPVMARTSLAVGVRFPDPYGRRDISGRVIAHDVVIYPPLSDDISSVSDAIATVWPLIEAEYAEHWDRTTP